jgi:hypothetical protein
VTGFQQKKEHSEISSSLQHFSSDDRPRLQVFLQVLDKISICLDFLPFSRSFYVIDIDTSKQQRLSFPCKIVASLSTNGFSTHACKEAALSTIKEPAKSRLLACCTCTVLRIY